MADAAIFDIDDVGAALREGRALRPAREYRIELGFNGLDFKPVIVPEASPTGADILRAGGLEASNDFSLLAILTNGEFEEVLLDQRMDLHGRGADRFIAFRTDRLFKLTLNKRLVQWGQPQLPGHVLYRLARAGENEVVVLEAASGRRVVEREEMLDLTTPGVEHFVTCPRTFDIIVNSRPRTVSHRKETFEELVHLAFPGAPTAGFAFSMTFRHVASTPHQGELAAGGFVEVKNGSVFNVTRTVQS